MKTDASIRTDLEVEQINTITRSIAVENESLCYVGPGLTSGFINLDNFGFTIYKMYK